MKKATTKMTARVSTPPRRTERAMSLALRMQKRLIQVSREAMR